MEQHIRGAIDSPLLQRVSKVREHMGLGVLPTEIPVSELDPFLVYLLRKEDDDDPALDANVILQGQQRSLLLEESDGTDDDSDEKWHLTPPWYMWPKNGS